MNYISINSLIEANRGTVVNFGSGETAPSDERIRRTEARLGLLLPESYKWFLRNYSGGEINGDEIFSIYQADDEEMPGGNLIYQYLTNERSGYIEKHEIPLMSTSFGEFFLFDSSIKRQDNEYPVYVKRGETKQNFADNFIEFLTKIINQNFE